MFSWSPVTKQNTFLGALFSNILHVGSFFNKRETNSTAIRNKTMLSCILIFIFLDTRPKH